MSPLSPVLQRCFHQAAELCKCPTGRLIRGYGLDDFLTNGIQEGDDAQTVAVKALRYFCEGARPADTRFQVAVLAVVHFLNHYASQPAQGTPVQAARDLVSILSTQGTNEAQLRQWITGHFG